MKQGFKKVLVYTLMLAMTLLPIPSAFSMPMQTSTPDTASHCAGMMDMTDHAMVMAVDAAADDSTVTCKCCGQCDGDCMGCTTVSAITFELLQLSDVTSREIYSRNIQSFHTRNTSPLSKPPLSL